MDLHSSPFSIQNLSINGVSQDRKMGEWFGPWALCTSIRSIWNERLASDSFLPSIKLVLSSDGTLVLKDISQDRPCLILLATRLGVTSINKNYYPTIKVRIGYSPITFLCGPLLSYYRKFFKKNILVVLQGTSNFYL